MLSLAVFGVTDAQPLSQLSDAFETLLVELVCTTDSAASHVRFWSLADILRCDSHVRFTPESGHSGAAYERPLRANSGRTQEQAGKHDRPCAPIAVHRIIAAGFLFATYLALAEPLP